MPAPSAGAQRDGGGGGGGDDRLAVAIVPRSGSPSTMARHRLRRLDSGRRS